MSFSSWRQFLRRYNFCIIVMHQYHPNLYLLQLRRVISLWESDLTVDSPIRRMVCLIKDRVMRQPGLPISMSSAFVARIAVTFALLGVMPATAMSSDDDMLRVSMNHARVLKLDRPVSKVIIGNSKVADATVADATTIVLTGRSFGTTNLVLLDSDGNAIVDQRVLVSIDEGNTVRVFRQTARTVLSCTPNCEEHSPNEGATSSGQ